MRITWSPHTFHIWEDNGKTKIMDADEIRILVHSRCVQSEDGQRGFLVVDGTIHETHGKVIITRKGYSHG